MECARMLKLGNLTEHLEELLHQAQEKQLTYPEFLLACLREEVRTRENRKYLCRLKAAGLPARHDLDRYDFTRTEGIDSRKLRELRELVWVGQAYNLLLAGGSGTGKTYIAAGLVHEAVKAGYRAYMVTLEDLLTCLKTRDVSRHAMKTYKRIMKAQLLAIDNATLFPLKREDIMLLFKLVNEFQITAEPVSGKYGQDGVVAGDGHAVPFHLRVEVLVTAVPSLSPVNPFLAGDIVMLPCLVELLLQLGHGTAVAFHVEHLFQIGGIRDDAVYEGLVLRVSFFLPLDEVGAG